MAGRKWASSVATFVRGRRDAFRNQAEAEAQRKQFADLEPELALLGIPPAVVAERKLTERYLRQAFRQRSRELHPDLNPWQRARAEQDDSVPDGAVPDGRPSIYELNAAYEKLKVHV